MGTSQIALVPLFEGFLEKAFPSFLEAGEGSGHENRNTLACTKFVPYADFQKRLSLGLERLMWQKKLAVRTKKQAHLS